MTPTFSVTDPITQVKGIGQATQDKLARLEISTVGDLLHHYPFRYLDFSRQVTIRELRDHQPASFLAQISQVKTFFSKTRKLITQAVAKDSSGEILLTWFNNPFIKRTLVVDRFYSIAGQPSFFGSKLTIISPVFEEGDSFSLNTKGLVPVYPQTAGLTSRWLRQKIFSLLSQVDLTDPLPADLLDQHHLLGLKQTVHQIHFPATASERWSADKRLSFNEHLRINLTNQLELLKLGPSVSLQATSQIDLLTQKKLPWTLTEDQQKVVDRIYLDLRQNTFTHRLIQGETGSGKTATLVFAANQCLAQGFSCVILAPTEVLAEQHFATFRRYSLYPENVCLVTTSSVTVVPNKPTVFIGTHALFSRLNPSLQPPLAFVAIDEQHKFGVAQREHLLQRSPVPHLFNLSATPIPRTVALGLLGDIHVSTIKHKPTNRLPTRTFVMSPAKFKDSPSWLIKELTAGNQIFIVCPNILTQKSQVSSVEHLAQVYRQLFPPQFPLWSLHGRLKPAEQKKIIDQFKAHPGSILVATSLIEVGLDIPSANIMIIHSAERFGLAQLHQLRGRVGRGEGQGYCFLIPSDEDGLEIERLQLLQKYRSGLTLAQKDLRLRGAGEIFGFRQHGELPTRLKHFWSKKLFLEAKQIAQKIVHDEPQTAARIASRLITW